MELLVQETNQAYRDSDVRQQIRLVAATEVDYDLREFTMHVALDHLAGKADGHMKEVHQLRDLYAADLVLLYRPFGGGTARLPQHPYAATAESLGFSVSNWHVFAHELGHNMGLLHHRSNDPSNLPYPYSHGYRFRYEGAEHGTIMASSEDLPRFSNPRQRFPNDLGVPLGVLGDTPTSSPNGPADAARSLNETAAAIANFRSSATRCQYDLSSPKDMAAMTAQGGTSTISIATAANCPWDAKSLAPGLSIAEVKRTGNGNGAVTFTVEENPGWPRELALGVAGEVYSFVQEGGRQSVSVCERSSSVREAISAELDSRSCADIAAEDLAVIGRLEVHGNVSPGDFGGLVGLGSLTLRLAYRGAIPHLEQGIFAGLESLEKLTLIAGQTNTLHLRRGVFEGLDALEELSLFSTSWEEGVFEDVPSLTTLHLQSYPRSVLPNGAFRGLNRLVDLSSRGGLFETLGARALQGLSSLRTLSILYGTLTHIPPGAFEDLKELISLSLSGNRLTALRRDQFQGAPKLEGIGLSDNPLRVVEPGTFSSLPLRALSLENADLTSLELGVFNELSNCGVNLSGNRLTTLDARVFEGAGFRYLNLSNNYISDIGFLSGVKWALSVSLSGNRIVDVSPLAGIGSISTLDVSRNRIVDVSPLASLPNHLDYLDLSYNEIDDISPLLMRVRGGSIGEDSSLFLHGNRLGGAGGAGHVATLRSRGVRVFLVSIVPMDSSAFEGEELEFAAGLSSEVGYSVTVDWQIFYLAFSSRQTVLANAQLTANAYDLGFGGLFETSACSGVLCYAHGVGGELTIGAADGVGKVTVSTDRDQLVEGHETFAFLLSRGASVFPEGVTLNTSWGSAVRRSVAVGLIVDPAGPSHPIPLFLARGDAWGRENILRLVHPMNGSPAHVEVFDSLGRRHGATTLSTRHDPSARRFDLSRTAVAQFDSEDLEDGNHDTGLSRGVGPGGSDWHLKVWTNDAVVLSYVRHADGFLTSVHDVARQEADGTYAVPFFNPASNTQQRSILRLVNSGTQASEVRIVGTDDAGATSDEAVSLSIEPGGVRELSSADLEAGAADLRGALGNGRGKWRFAVASDEPLWWRVCSKAPPDT